MITKGMIVLKYNGIIISDIHFGAIDPKVEYQILEEQFISKLYQFSSI